MTSGNSLCQLYHRQNYKKDERRKHPGTLGFSIDRGGDGLMTRPNREICRVKEAGGLRSRCEERINRQRVIRTDLLTFLKMAGRGSHVRFPCRRLWGSNALSKRRR